MAHIRHSAPTSQRSSVWPLGSCGGTDVSAAWREWAVLRLSDRSWNRGKPFWKPVMNQTHRSGGKPFWKTLGKPFLGKPINSWEKPRKETRCVLSGKSYRFNVFTHFGLVVWLCHSCAKPLCVHCGLIPYFGDIASMRLLQFFAGHDAMYVLFFLASKGWLCYLASKELCLALLRLFVRHCGFCH